MTTTFKVYTDASSRYKAVMEGASGDKKGRRVHPSSIGAVIKDGCEVVGSISKRLAFKILTTLNFWRCILLAVT